MKDIFKKCCVIIVLIVFCVSSLFFYNVFTDKGVTIKCVTSMTESEIFTEKEIEKAMAAVKTKFRDFEGCELLELTYDEEFCKREVESYMNNGKGSSNGVKTENVLILKSSFDSVRPKGDRGLTTGITYNGWIWILIRDSENGNWKVDDWGY